MLRAKAIRELVRWMIKTDMLPISVVEGKVFKELVWYIMPARAPFTIRFEKHIEEKS